MTSFNLNRLDNRVIALLLSPLYQLFSSALPQKIVGTLGTIKVLLPDYQVYKCNNFQNIIIFERSKPASLCHCLLVICHLGSLDHAIKKSEDLNQRDE
jgi:hypothetical protein